MEHPENSRNELEPSETKYYNPLLSWKHIKTPTTLKVLIFVGMKISRISLCKKKKSIYLFVKLNTREFFSFEMILDYRV